MEKPKFKTNIYDIIRKNIKQMENNLTLTTDIEVWDDGGCLEFKTINTMEYVKYTCSIRQDGQLEVHSLRPYDEQNYHYAIGNKVFRNGVFVKEINDTDEFLSPLDKIILELIELDRPLKAIICYN